ncbi:MAG: SLBB domain-containing protein [Candidatus Cloacimonetes bacterium]|nr:SLBB domain-containing protein [Candidatus Cloacimonadota bacterium]MBL7148772.1 SLBB domain-containing protein [Candidatus Cloacimonadota bacterium]
MKKIILLLIFLMFSSVILAQTEGATSAYNPASIYLYTGTLAGTEQLKIKAYIWGQVQKPGLYIVPDNTDLLTLISSAGGPTENAKLSKIRIIRTTEEGDKVIWVNIKKYLETGNPDLIPVLKPGDTVVVSGSTYYAFTKAVDWLAQIAIILSVYVAISNIR